MNKNHLPSGWTHERVGMMLSAWLADVSEELLSRLCSEADDAYESQSIFESLSLAQSGIDEINEWVRRESKNPFN